MEDVSQDPPDAVRLSNMFLESLREGDIHKAHIQITVLNDVMPPEPVVDLNDAGVRG